jgi:hypothetical protein
MSVFDDYLVDPRLSLLDKTRIQAQVLVPVLRALRAGMGKAAADAIVKQALREWSKQLFVAIGAGIDGSPRRKWAAMHTALAEKTEQDVTVKMLRHDHDALEFDVTTYDLRSAYPAAMLDLPCQLHTQWQHKQRARRLPEGELYLANVSFSHSDELSCGLPFRQNGMLFWPFQGTGWYWSVEIEAARRFLHTSVIVRDLWIARRGCDCRPFNWVRDVYEKRRQIGSDTRGYPLKLGLNFPLRQDGAALRPRAV